MMRKAEDEKARIEQTKQAPKARGDVKNCNDTKYQ